MSKKDYKSVAILSTALALGFTLQPSAQSNLAGALNMSSSVNANVKVSLAAAEARYVSQTLQLGRWLKESSQQAQTRLTNPYLKAFAQAEVAEQDTVAEVMKTLLGNSAMAPRYGTSQQRLLTAQGRTQVGMAYDRAYLTNQLAVHRQLLAAQETYLQSATHTHLAIVAKLVRGHVRDHVALLEYMTELAARETR